MIYEVRTYTLKPGTVPDGRAGLRRQDRRAGETLAAGGLLAQRGRHAEPDHPYLAVQGHQRARQDPRRGRREEGLAAGDRRLRGRDGEQDPDRRAVLAQLRAGRAWRHLRVPHLYLRAEHDPQGDGSVDASTSSRARAVAADLRGLPRHRHAQPVGPCLGLQEHGRARAHPRRGRRQGHLAAAARSQQSSCCARRRCSPFRPSSRRSSEGGIDDRHHPPGRALLRGRSRRHRHAKADDAGRRSRRSMPAWRSTPCWCSATRTSTMPSSSPSPRAWARSSMRSAPACAPPTRRACRRPSPTSPTSTRTTSPTRATTAAGCSPSAIACGIRTARSRWCRRSIRCCMRSASRPRAATRSSPTCARPTMRSTTETKAEVEDMVCEHSQMYSRQIIGFYRFHRRGARALQAGAPVHGAHPSVRGASRSTSRAMPARSSAGRCPRRAATCAT